MTTSLIAKDVSKDMAALGQLSVDAREQIAAAKEDEWTRTALIAASTQRLLELMTPPVVAMFRQLQNNALGFRTDKTEGYSDAQLKPVLVQALLLGLRPTNNEINVIGGNLYAAKEGCRRLCRELVQGLEFIPGIPEIHYQDPITMQGRNGEYTVRRCVAYVPCRLRYRIDGRQCEDVYEGDYRIVCKVDGGSEDQAIGKAERKAYMRLYQKLQGLSLGEEVEESAIDTTAQRTDAFQHQPTQLDVFAHELQSAATPEQREAVKADWRETVKTWSAQEKKRAAELVAQYA